MSENTTGQDTDNIDKRDDKLKIDTGETSVTVYPGDDGEYVKPSIMISVKPKEHQQKGDHHHFEQPISVGTGASFGLTKEQVDEVNNHLAWLKSEYFTQMRP